VQRARHFPDDDDRRIGRSERFQSICEIARARRREPTNPLERIREVELRGDLRPPGSILERDMGVDLQAACGRRLNTDPSAPVEK
jgi:hypothetical protein